jgi:hypothetical protein
VGFEPTHISVVEIQAALKSTALDHSAIVSDGEIDKNFEIDNPYSTKKTTAGRGRENKSSEAGMWIRE